MQSPHPKNAFCVLYTHTPRHGIAYLLGMEGISMDKKSVYWEGGKWGGFGGKREANETIYQTCVREMYEETAGCVYSLARIHSIFTDQQISVCVRKKYRKGTTACYFIWVPYEDYPSRFRLCKEFCQYVHGDINVIEKTHLRWFGHNEIVNADQKIQKKFRHKLLDMMSILNKNSDALRQLTSADPPTKCLYVHEDGVTDFFSRIQQ